VCRVLARDLFFVKKSFWEEAWYVPCSHPLMVVVDLLWPTNVLKNPFEVSPYIGIKIPIELLGTLLLIGNSLFVF
jgi:hypothetical protein